MVRNNRICNSDTLRGIKPEDDVREVKPPGCNLISLEREREGWRERARGVERERGQSPVCLNQVKSHWSFHQSVPTGSARFYWEWLGQSWERQRWWPSPTRWGRRTHCLQQHPNPHKPRTGLYWQIRPLSLPRRTHCMQGCSSDLSSLDRA